MTVPPVFMRCYRKMLPRLHLWPTVQLAVLERQFKCLALVAENEF